MYIPTDKSIHIMYVDEVQITEKSLLFEYG